MSINWSALGVPLSEQLAVPTADTFPSRCNPRALPMWRTAVSSTGSTVPATAWARTFDKYLQLCRAKGVHPITSDEVRNDQIYTKLIDARRLVVKFIDQHRLADELKVRTTKRTVRMTNTGFVLKAEGHCEPFHGVNTLKGQRPSVIDKMGLRTNSSTWASRWSRSLAANVEFYVVNEGTAMSGRWYYGYSVTVDIFPAIPGSIASTTQELENFVLKIIYLPILRAYRPQGLMHRLV